MEGDRLAEAVRAGDRTGLGRAITLVESTRDDHRDAAQELLLAVQPAAGNAARASASRRPSRRSGCI